MNEHCELNVESAWSKKKGWKFKYWSNVFACRQWKKNLQTFSFEYLFLYIRSLFEGTNSSDIFFFFEKELHFTFIVQLLYMFTENDKLFSRHCVRFIPSAE